MPSYHDFELTCRQIERLRARRRRAMLSVALGQVVPIAAACALMLLGLAILAAFVMR